MTKEATKAAVVVSLPEGRWSPRRFILLYQNISLASDLIAKASFRDRRTYVLVREDETK